MSLLQDARFAVRTLSRAPGFTAAAILSLAIGVGVNTAVFTLANALLFRPLPVSGPRELIRVHSSFRGSGYFNISYSEYLYFRDQNHIFSGMIAYFPTITMALGTKDEPEAVTGEAVSGNYFSVLGVKPILGRAFLPEEDQTPGSHAVVVLSHQLWQRRFGGDPSVIGSNIRINGYLFSVVGVAPKSFQGTFAALSSALWVPLMMHREVFHSLGSLQDRDARLLMGMGRLKPGTSLEEARVDLGRLAEQLKQAYPKTNKDRGVKLEQATGVHPALTRIVSTFLALLMSIVGMTLLIACTNIANLLLARGATRTREIAIRLSLGATRLRLVRQLLTESVLLALTGGTIGTLFAFWLSRLLVSFLPPLPFAVELNLYTDLRVLMFSLVVSILTGLVFGLLPALHASHTEFVSALKGIGAQQIRRRFALRDLFLIAQLALSLVLLLGAGLLVQSLRNANQINAGCDPDNVVVASLDVDLLHCDEARGRSFYRAFIEDVNALPYVESATLARFVPLSGQGDSVGVVIEGQEPPTGTDAVQVGYNIVGPRYFNVVRIPFLQGRDFRVGEGRSSSEVIINEAMAQRLWPGKGSPAGTLGKRIRLTGAHGPFLEIVGIVRTGKYSSLADERVPFLYLPFQGEYRSDMTLHVRAQAPSQLSALISNLRSVVRNLDRDLPLSNVGPMRSRMGFALTPARLAELILGISTLVALASFVVSRRTNEIGIRLALGAAPSDVRALLMRQAMARVAIGLAIGLAMSTLTRRALASLLYGISGTDPVTIAGVSGILVAVALLANYAPIRRAMKVDPAIALRQE